MDHFRSQGVTSGICQCHLRLRSERAVYAHSGSIALPDLHVDQTLVKLLKKPTNRGVLTPFPVMAVPMTGQHVVTKLTPHCTSILMPC